MTAWEGAADKQGRCLLDGGGGTHTGVMACMWGQSSREQVDGMLSCSTQDLSLGCIDSLVAACRLSCPAACGILVFRPGIKPMSPALDSEFLTAGPPGKLKTQPFSC